MIFVFLFSDERLIKNLALESAQIKRPRSSLRLSKSRQDMTSAGATSGGSSTKQDHNSLNKSIENLITVNHLREFLFLIGLKFYLTTILFFHLQEGQNLLEEIRITADKSNVIINKFYLHKI